MARLTDAAGQFLDLTLLRYAFEAGTVWERHDLNWLCLQLTLNQASAQWSATARTLLTWEVSELATWLCAAAMASSAVPMRWHAIDPSLAFEAERVGDSVQLRAHLNYRFLPPERFDGLYHRGDDSIVAFALTAPAVCHFADALEQELQPFPVREAPPGYRGPP